VSVPAKLVAFAVVLALSFGAAYGVGAAVGPIDDAQDDPHTTATTITPMADADHGGEHGG
jgi:hypothetical protein